jgi:putative Holliday junction resolvase
MTLTSGHRIAIDYGEKWVGIAISDESGLIASPVGTFDIADIHHQLIAISKEKKVAVLYLGLPIHLSGNEGKSAQNARDFAQTIEKLNIAPVRLIDERLSTKSASQGKSLVSKFGIDAVAATEILNFALEGERIQKRFFGKGLDE